MMDAIKIFPRTQINTTAWDACIRSSIQRLVYGYSWYLDAVLPAPGWKWVGLVLLGNAGQYQAVMPVPLRRKSLIGVYQKWVVHQPFFCQFLSVFSRDECIDTQPFFDLLISQFQYGSIFAVRTPSMPDNPFDFCQLQATHVLDLSAGYNELYQSYTRDRKLNLYRAKRANWTVVDSTDIKPLLRLFRNYHATTIEGGVADWAYAIFQNLFEELTKRDLVVLRYAVQKGKVEAGALFVCEGKRIIFLFNAASLTGRRANARTLLIDGLIQEKAGQPTQFDFESPIKSSIRTFYQSFGAVEEPFLRLSWNRLNAVEKALLASKRRLYG